MNKIFFIIGASGAGKTTAVKKIQESNGDDFNILYFDSVGVPSNKEMIRDYGSGEEWQRVTTKYWVKKITDDFSAAKLAILDGQIKPSFIEEACKLHDTVNYTVVLFDCSNEARIQRLVNRGNPELTDEQMMNWSKYLREESKKRGYTIINNTNMSEEETRDKLLEILNG